MQFRRMTLDDLDQVAAFSMAGLRAHLYPLWPSQEKVRHVVRHFIESETDFHLDIQLVVKLNDNVFFQKSWLESIKRNLV